MANRRARQQHQQQPLRCDYCKHVDPPPFIRVDPESGETVCTHCGTVLDDRYLWLDAEWRTFDDTEKDQTRAEQTWQPPGLDASYDTTFATPLDTLHRAVPHRQTSIVATRPDFSRVLAGRIYALREELRAIGVHIPEPGFSRITATGSGVYGTPPGGDELPFTEEQGEKLERALHRMTEHLQEGYRYVRQIANMLDIQSHMVIDRACLVLRHCEAGKTFRVRCNSLGDTAGERAVPSPYHRVDFPAAAVAVQLAALSDGVKITFAELSVATGVTKKVLKRLYKSMAFYCGRRANLDFTEISHSLVIRFCRPLGLSTTATKAVMSYVDKARSLGITGGRNPLSIVAAAIQFVSQYTRRSLSLHDIAVVTNISVYAINNVLQVMQPYEDQFIEAFPVAFKRAHDDMVREAQRRGVSRSPMGSRSPIASASRHPSAARRPQ